MLDHCGGHGTCSMPGSSDADADGVETFAEQASMEAQLEEMMKLIAAGNTAELDEISEHGGTHGFLGCKCNEGWRGFMCKEQLCEPACREGRGRCFDGSCQCFPGFTGQLCELEACQDKCNGNGKCVQDACECNDGFSGYACEVGPGGCPAKDGAECAGHGVCRDGRCFCRGLFLAPDCARRACLDDCFGHGDCDNGVCKCREGFSGDKCQFETKEKCVEKAQGADNACPACGGHGHCEPGVDACQCDAGWGGFGCQEELCPGACSGHGTCDESVENVDEEFAGMGTCQCQPTYGGPACLARVCRDPKCSGHGTCAEGGLCRCTVGWGGESCEFRLCPGEQEQCSGNGTCVDGACQCNVGWEGDACTVASCPTDDPTGMRTCSGHGECHGDPKTGRSECICGPAYPPPYEATSLYTGVDCSQRQCPVPGCAGHGSCRSGLCVCEEGWAGAGCGQVLDRKCHKDGDCNFPNGICDGGHCFCREGLRHGANCSSQRKVSVEDAVAAAEAHQKLRDEGIVSDPAETEGQVSSKSE
jgi:hypothetical protein